MKTFTEIELQSRFESKTEVIKLMLAKSIESTNFPLLFFITNRTSIYVVK